MSKPDAAVFVDRYRIFRCIIRKNGQLSLLGGIMSILLFLIFPLLNFSGAYIDQTLYMTGNGKGLMQHYGVWVGFITTPFIFILVSIAVCRFITLLQNLDKYLKSENDYSKISKTVKWHLDSISLNGRSKYILLLSMLIGLMFLIINMRQTQNPILVYGNDVYDAAGHIFGFISAKLFLLFMWIFFYPLMMFIIVHMYLSLISIARKMYRLRIFNVDIFNKDGCGGSSEFGNLILLINGVYVCIFAIMFALKATHTNNYFILNFFLIGLGLFFIVHNSLGIYHLHRILKENKTEILTKVNSDLRSHLNRTGLVPEGLMELRKHLLSMRTNPYTDSGSKIIKLIQFIPSIAGIVGGYLVPLLNIISRYFNSAT